MIPAYFLYSPDLDPLDFRCRAYALKQNGKLVALEVNYFIRQEEGSDDATAMKYKIIFLEINKSDYQYSGNGIRLNQFMQFYIDSWI